MAPRPPLLTRPRSRERALASLSIAAVALGCLGLGALAPTTACNGTGTTPMCDFPDGANNPESGCGVLIEAAAAEGAAEDVATPVDVDAEVGDAQAGGDVTVPQDAHVPTGADASDAHIDAVAPSDAPADVAKG